MLGMLSLTQLSVLLVQFCNSQGASLARAPQWWLLLLQGPSVPVVSAVQQECVPTRV